MCSLTLLSHPAPSRSPAWGKRNGGHARLYEARGLVTPARSQGGTRLYSENDLKRLRVIGQLLENGLNLAGVDMVLDLQEANERLQGELDARADSADGRTWLDSP